MIIVTGRHMIIPDEDVMIGFQGDSKIETREFQLDRYYNGVDLSRFEFRLDVMGSSRNIVNLDKEVGDEHVALTWTVMEEHLQDRGAMLIQLRAWDGADVIWHSAIGKVVVAKSIEAKKAFEPVPSEFYDMERRIAGLRDDAGTARDAAEGYKDEAEQARDAAEGYKDEAQGVLSALIEKADKLITVGSAEPDFGVWIQTEEVL